MIVSYKSIVGLAAILLAVSVLCALGTWQVQRLHEKQKVLAQIDAAEGMNPKALLNLTPGPDGTYGFRAGVLSGRKLPAGIGLMRGAVRIPYLFVLTKEGVAVPVKAEGISLTHGRSLRLFGYLKDAGRPNPFVPDNRPPTWYWLEAAALRQVVKAPVIAAEFIPWTREKEGPLPRPANNHLAYAFFWFGMAALLLGLAVVRRKTNS